LTNASVDADQKRTAVSSNMIGEYVTSCYLTLLETESEVIQESYNLRKLLDADSF